MSLRTGKCTCLIPSTCSCSNESQSPEVAQSIIMPTPYKRCLLEEKIFISNELPLLMETLNEARMNLGGKCPEFQDYIKSRTCKSIIFLNVGIKIINHVHIGQLIISKILNFNYAMVVC